MAGLRQEESVTRQLVFAAADFSVLMAFWIALTGDFRIANLAIGAAAALLGTILSVLTEALTFARFLPRARYLWASRSVVWQVPLGVFSVVRLLLTRRHDRGRFHYVAFNPGREDASSHARRGIAEALPTMSPTSLVIGVDRPRRRVIFHLLGTKSAPPTLRRLGEME